MFRNNTCFAFRPFRTRQHKYTFVEAVRSERKVVADRETANADYNLAATTLLFLTASLVADRLGNYRICVIEVNGAKEPLRFLRCSRQELMATSTRANTNRTTKRRAIVLLPSTDSVGYSDGFLARAA